jgi:hypothetical protein
MRLVLGRLIWKFDWELALGSDRWKDALVFKAWSTKPLKVKFIPVLRRSGVEWMMGKAVQPFVQRDFYH